MPARREQGRYIRRLPPNAAPVLRRPCPKCEAAAGHSCRRWISEKVTGQNGGGRWERIKGAHVERKANRS